MSKREETKAIEDTQRVAEEAKSIRDIHNAAQTLQKVGLQQEVIVQDFQRTFHRSLDDAKENVRDSIDETRAQIPRFTKVVTHYQEQILESTGKTIKDYVDVQRLVIDSVINFAAPYYEVANRIHDYWLSPRVTTETYIRSVSNVAESVSASLAIGNNILFRNIEAFGNALERAQRHTEVLSRINVDNAKTITNTARVTAVELTADT